MSDALFIGKNCCVARNHEVTFLKERGLAFN